MKHLLTIWTVFTCNLIFAQQPFFNQRPDYLKANSYWAFGQNAGLDFSTGIGIPVHSEIFSEEGCASVSDPVTGKLLFYSNGGEIWNANHKVMPNGSGLFGNKSWQNGDHSSIQGVCIVPVINNPDKYYLFSLSGTTSSGPRAEGTLFYNIIDMNLDNGLGDVMPGKKNIGLDSDTLSESMIAIPGNNCDIWLMVHHQNKHQFKAYRITKDGIDTSPVVSNTGSLRLYFGSMAVSGDRTKIAITSGNEGALMGLFNPLTGEVTNAMRIAAGYFTSAAFSPDDSKLYLSERSNVFQYDISNYDSTIIFASRTLIASGLNLTIKSGLATMRLYKDKIYLGGDSSLNCIAKPNLMGTACDLQRNVIQLLPGDKSWGNFGNNVILPLIDTFYEPAHIITCTSESQLTLDAPQGFNEYEWEDGSTSTSRTINTPGTYWVVSKDFCKPRVDTFKVLSMGFPVPVINVNVRRLSTTEAYDTYQWMFNGVTIPGATQDHYNVEPGGNGDYEVIVSRGDCSDTSDTYTVTNADEGTSINDIDLLRNQIHIYPNPTKDIISFQSNIRVNIAITSIEGKVVGQEENVNSFSVKNFSDGIYFLHVSDRKDRLIKVIKFTKSK